MKSDEGSTGETGEETGHDNVSEQESHDDASSKDSDVTKGDDTDTDDPTDASSEDGRADHKDEDKEPDSQASSDEQSDESSGEGDSLANEDEEKSNLEDSDKIANSSDHCSDGCCQREHLVDFDTTPYGASILAGERLTTQYEDIGLTIGSRSCYRSKWLIAFDSANPTGGDRDLKTPGSGWGNHKDLGHLLIIAENKRDRNYDGYVDDPDDHAFGGCMAFYFDEPVLVSQIDVVDIEKRGGSIWFWRGFKKVSVYPIPAKGDNSVQTLSFELPRRATSMKVCLRGSGAVDNLKFSQCE